jgi:type I restriction enzyme S subunit
MVTYPTDWEKVQLANLMVKGGSGGTPNTSKEEYYKGKIPFLSITDITNSNGNIYKTEKSISELGLNSSAAWIVPAEALTLAMYASVGKVAILKKDIATSQAFYNMIFSDLGTRDFVYYYLKKFDRDNLWNPLISTGTQDNLNAKKIRNLEIFLPPLPEQKAIASVLSDFDEHIDNLTKLIEKKKAIRDGALDDLLSGRTRINGFDVEWIESTIEDSTKEIITGGTPSTKVDKYWGGSIPWLASTEIHQKIITRATKNITKIGLNNSSAKMAPKDSVLIALAGQGKTRGTAAFLAYPMALNQSLAALVAADETDSKFLYYLIENMYVELRELSSGDGGRGGLNKTLIKNINIRLPREIKEQQAIASVLTAMDEEIESLETEKEKMMQIKEGAMDDLLTGRVRLKV